MFIYFIYIIQPFITLTVQGPEIVGSIKVCDRKKCLLVTKTAIQDTFCYSLF